MGFKLVVLGLGIRDLGLWVRVGMKKGLACRG